MKRVWLLQILIVPLAVAQVSNIVVSTTTTQAILQYSSPVDEACTLKVADMNRLLAIVSGVYSNGIVTITTSGTHGLAVGSIVYIEGTGVSGWDGWQTLSSVTATGFTFPSAAPGQAIAGNAGVLIEDVNPELFPGADLDSRSGNLNSGRSRVFVVGQRTADIASDGKRYTRAQQAYSRHHFTLTCGTQVLHQDYTTKNLPLGDTHNDGPPVDRGRPGQYAYPTVNWSNRMYSLIDPLTGIRSFRATNPVGTASTAQEFQTARDPESAWANDAGPLTTGGGAARITGSVSKLFLRADNLTLSGGATFTSGYGEGTSLDWITATFAGSSISNGSCVGDACKVVACLTVNGVSCASGNKEITLTATPASHTVGSGGLMDLWQTTGGPGIARPDVCKASGTVDYVASTKVVNWVSGHKFSIKWGAGSRIVVNGTEYPIASVQSERTLTLSSGPVGNLTGTAYSANNFGILIWKKTTAADQVSIGYATFRYGSSVNPAWASLPVQNCSSAVVTVDGVTGYNCFIDQELYWVAADGSSLVDLGFVETTYWPSDERWGNRTCGTSADFSMFDPSVPDTWYCMLSANSTDQPLIWRYSIIKATYHGAHTARTNGLKLPDCGLNGAVEPCVEFIRMQPLSADAVEVAGPAFNSEFASSGYSYDPTREAANAIAYFRWGGISPDGVIMIYTSEPAGQASKGWQFMFTLGDRTPAGTGPDSFRPIAAASSYLHYPLRWCAIHTSGTPTGNGWQPWGCNPLWIKGANANYAMTLTSADLTATVDGTGGPTTCPSNPYGINGKNCTAITVSGEPARVADAAYLQDLEVGDVIVVATLSGGAPVYATSEYVRVLVKTDAQHITVQRGYLETVKDHAGQTTLVMACGLRNSQEIHNGFWDFTNDPYGLNANGDTILVDAVGVGGHTGLGHEIRVESAGTWYRLGESFCPQAMLGTYGVCYQVRRGPMPALLSATSLGVAVNPPFGGQLGVGNPNQVDAHPGPCTNSWCLDGRPMDGGTGGGMLGSADTPWVNTSGQLWKLAGGATGLHLKHLALMAYVGRSALVDISGPASVLPTDSTGSYQYCIALAANECVTGSTAGDAYINAPYVSVPYCDYPGIAQQGDDTNSICIGPLGPYTGNVVQMGVSKQDLTGSTSRRLGIFFSRWNQLAVFWNALSTPNGRLIFSQIRWLDGVRHEDVISIVPPYPAGDSIARNTFLPVEVRISPPAERLVDNVVVEFGYPENDGPDHFFCTSRQETCLAVDTKVNQENPFFFAESEIFSGAACASGCTVTIPALSQRVLYYRWKYRDASGQVVATSDTRAIATP